MSRITITIIIIVILLIFVLLIFLINKKCRINNIETLETSNHDQMYDTNNIMIKKQPDLKTALIFKTHIWSSKIEKFTLKLKRETNNYIDFYILMHSDDKKLIKKIKNLDLKKHVIMFSENEIKNMYKTGFYSMWLSNHWILLWFFNKYPYEYIWSMEYDVRISGNSTRIWTYKGTEDFLYPIEPFKDPNWTFKDYYVGGKLNDDDKYYGYLQLTRYSKHFLQYLHKCFKEGENGQDELIIYSLFKRGKFTGSNTFLNSLIKDSWTVDPNFSDTNTTSYEKSEKEYEHNNNHLRIFHPVKV